MKKFILGTALVASSLMAEVSTITPYIGYVDYDSNPNKSIKDNGKLAGLTYTVGNLSYLLELGYSHLNSSYKESNTTNIADLRQDDFTIIYGEYKTNYTAKVGYHYTSTTDTTLGNGHIFNFTLGSHKYVGYDKYSYGLESYYSYYTDVHDENGTQKSNVGIIQFTPYVSFYKAININTSNTITLKLNYERASDYTDKSYTAVEFSDTLAYKSFFTTLGYYSGKAKTAVRDGGYTVYNSLDLLKTGYSLKLGYYINPKTILSLSYAKNNYREDGATEDGTNSVLVSTLNYTF